MHLSRFALFTLLAAAACSKSEDTTSPPQMPAGTDAGPTLVDFTMYAVDPGANPADAWTGVAGAAAFLDTAGGNRIEATSEADGRIVFKGVDFSAGPVSVTGYLAGHIMATVVGITPEAVTKLPLPAPTFATGGKNPLLFMPLIDRPAEDTARVTGTFKNKLDPANTISLTAVGGRGIFQAATDTYSLPVAKGQPLTFIGMEWNGGSAANGWNETKLRWLKLDVPAQTADATVDVDMTTGTALTPTKITVTLKTKDASLLGGSPGWQINSMEHFMSMFLGSRSVVTPNPDNQTFTAAGEYVASPSTSETPFTFAYFPGRGGSTGGVQYTGVPKDGDTIEALAFPKAPSTSVVGADVALSEIDPAAEAVGIQYVDHQAQNVDRPLWQVSTVQFAPIPASIHLPDLPDAARAMLTGTLRGRVNVIAGKIDDAHPNVASRFSFSSFFALGK